jgi:8-oxo-dGTP diphosphatase
LETGHGGSLSFDTIRVLAAVIQRDDRFLVCRRPLHKRHGGLWEFPGGKVEPPESDASAARRELREELGVEVTAVGKELFAAHDDNSPYLIAFTEVDIQGTPSCHEHLDLRWCALSELGSLPLAPSDLQFVHRVLLRNAKSS